MKKTVFAFLLLFIFGANAAIAQTTINQLVYKGKIGKQDIVLEILQASENKKTYLIYGRYFYEKHRTIIQTFGTKDKSQILLKEAKSDCVYNENDCEFRAKMNLNLMGQNISGQWVDNENKNKSYPITLKLYKSKFFLNVKKPKNPLELQTFIDENNKYENPFLNLQLNNNNSYSFKTQIGSVGYIQVTDRFTGVNYPYLTAYKDEKSLKKIQNLMAKNRMRMVSYALECKGRDNSLGVGYGTFGGWDEYQSKVIYTNENLLVIEESGSTDCGGAHPNNSLSHTIFDLVNGETFKPNKYFNLYENFKSEYEFDKTAQYQEFLKKLDKNSKYFIGYKEEKFFNECIESGFDYDFSMHFDSKGVIFSLENLPHVIGACMGDYFKVPYSDIKHLMRPEGKKFFAKYIN